MNKYLDKKRQERFRHIAQDEVSCNGFRKYSPINRGPIVNGLIIAALALVVPFYLGGKYISNRFKMHGSDGQ